MRRYETVVIVNPDSTDDEIQSFKDRYGVMIKDGGGEVIKIEDWGVKRLAYLLKKKDKGRYVLLDYVGVPALVTEMERRFRIAEEVLKYLTVKLDDNVDLEAFKSQAEEVKADEPEPAASPPPAPEPPADSEPAATPDETASEPAPAPDAEPEPEKAVPAQETAESPEAPAAEDASSAAPSTPETPSEPTDTTTESDTVKEGQ